MPVVDVIVDTLFKELLNEVIAMKKGAKQYQSTLEKLLKILTSLKPNVDKIVAHHKSMKEKPKEADELEGVMRRGTDLLKKCSDDESPWWHGCWTIKKKADYQEELDGLYKEIEAYAQLDLQFEIASNVLEMHGKVDQILHAVVKTEKTVLKVYEALEPPEFTVGLDTPLKELMRKLHSDSDKDSVMAVTGPRGSGKTTLAQKFCWDKQVTGIFKENIFFVPVGKDPNLSLITQNLMKRKGEEVPQFQRDEDAVIRLKQFLNDIGKEEPILLVLDDVWPESEYLVYDLKIKNIKKYKILVTTEYKKFRSSQALTQLSVHDATKLFRHSASLDQAAENIEIPNDELVNKIVQGCGKSPLALTVTGNSLNGRNLKFWRDMVRSLSKGHGYFDGKKNKVLSCLQESVDNLDDGAKECFKNLALFPEGQRIPAAALVDMWAELHDKTDEVAMENIRHLSNMNMADIIVTRKLDAEDIDDYNNRYVTHHGLLRELAIYQSSQEQVIKRDRLIIEINRNQFPTWWPVGKEDIEAKILSISTDEKFNSEWRDFKPTQVKALVLNIQAQKCKLPMFIQKMDELKVLAITNFNFSRAELENFEVIDNLPNLKRLRLEKVSIPFLRNVGMQLGSLRKCSFFMCDTTQFSDMLLLPSLEEMYFDYCTMVKLPFELGKSVLLNKLKITNCHQLSELPEGIENLKCLETLMLSSCSGLQELPESITSLEGLTDLDISDCTSLTKLPDDIGELKNLEKFNVKGCSRIAELPDSITDLESLKEVVCDEEDMAPLWEAIKDFFINKDLVIKVVQAEFKLDFLS